MEPKKNNISVKNIFEQEDWEEYYTRERLIHIKPKTGIFTSYDIFLCDYILQTYIPAYTGSIKKKPKICEIGSGDGKLLKKFADIFGYEPYGIEYSKEAARIAAKRGIEFIVKDAFDKEVLQEYKNYFDFVFSYGFIEHIYPPEKAVKLHLDLLKPGGYFFIQIPRFKGFNLLKAKIFRPELIPLHNLAIMEKDVLEKLCNLDNVEKLYCGNYGTLKLRLPMDKKNFRYYVLKTLCLLEYIINPALRLLFKDKGFETTTFSPAVLFIGRKKK